MMETPEQERRRLHAACIAFRQRENRYRRRLAKIRQRCRQTLMLLDLGTDKGLAEAKRWLNDALIESDDRLAESRRK